MRQRARGVPLVPSDAVGGACEEEQDHERADGKPGNNHQQLFHHVTIHRAPPFDSGPARQALCATAPQRFKLAGRFSSPIDGNARKNAAANRLPPIWESGRLFFTRGFQKNVRTPPLPAAADTSGSLRPTPPQVRRKRRRFKLHYTNKHMIVTGVFARQPKGVSRSSGKAWRGRHGGRLAEPQALTRRRRALRR